MRRRSSMWPPQGVPSRLRRTRCRRHPSLPGQMQPHHSKLRQSARAHQRRGVVVSILCGQRVCGPASSPQTSSRWRDCDDALRRVVRSGQGFSGAKGSVSAKYALACPWKLPLRTPPRGSHMPRRSTTAPTPRQGLPWSSAGCAQQHWARRRLFAVRLELPRVHVTSQSRSLARFIGGEHQAHGSSRRAVLGLRSRRVHDL